MQKVPLVRDEGVAGSNPATPTSFPEVQGPNPDSFPDSCGSAAPSCARCWGRGVIASEITSLGYICDHCQGSGRPLTYWPTHRRYA
jgi:hypothetical protein